MPILQRLRGLFRPPQQRESDPAEAYDSWSPDYDHQPDNLILALDRALCRELLAGLSLDGRTIVDVGCGTGRHWTDLYNRLPARLVGYDVSKGMLDRLLEKYPHAETHLLSAAVSTSTPSAAVSTSTPSAAVSTSNPSAAVTTSATVVSPPSLTAPFLSLLDDSSCDLVLSTLTVAHLPELSVTLAEWNRVLKPGGKMLITDFHPDALARGGQRTFRKGDRLVAVRSHIYPIPHLLAITRRLGLVEITIIERKIEESMRPWYERQNALPVFRRFLGIPIIYGLLLKKPDAAK